MSSIENDKGAAIQTNTKNQIIFIGFYNMLYTLNKKFYCGLKNYTNKFNSGLSDLTFIACWYRYHEY